MESRPGNRGKRNSRRRRAWRWAGVVTAAIVVGTTVVRVGHHGSPNGHPPTVRYVAHAVTHVGSAVVRLHEPENVLLIANNARDAAHPLSLGSAAGQADIILVAHFDPARHIISLISIPRDTLVAMPGYRVPIPKIKTAFTLGLQKCPTCGPELEMDYVSRLTGLDIHHYIVTNFQGFIDAVNAIGGIPVHVEKRIYDPYYSGANFQPGDRWLTGSQALAFVRVRQNQAGNGYRVNDFERQQAEMQVLRLVKQRLLESATKPVQLIRMVEVWRRDVATNVGTTQLAAMAMEASKSKLQTIQLGSIRDSMNLAGTPFENVNRQNYLVGAYYDVLDPKEITRQLACFGAKPSNVGLPQIPDPSSVWVRVYGRRSTYERLLALGFHATYAGKTVAKRTSVYYPIGQMPWGWAVAREVGDPNAWVAPVRNGSQQVELFAP